MSKIGKRGFAAGSTVDHAREKAAEEADRDRAAPALAADGGLMTCFRESNPGFVNPTFRLVVTRLASWVPAEQCFRNREPTRDEHRAVGGCVRLILRVQRGLGGVAILLVGGAGDDEGPLLERLGADLAQAWPFGSGRPTARPDRRPAAGEAAHG